MKVTKFEKNIYDQGTEEEETVYSFDSSIGIAGIFYIDATGKGFSADVSDQENEVYQATQNITLEEYREALLEIVSWVDDRIANKQ